MTNYFKRLFDYDQFANKQMIDLLLKTGAAGKPIDLMAHLLVAQQRWLTRCKYLPEPQTPLWPNWETTSLATFANSNFNEWMEYLDSLTTDDFDRIITYKNTKGVTFNDKLSDILAHVINHGTHHRAQIGWILKQSGTELPVSDYIMYIREQS
ncbi:DinB family protein [Mucilaginibacter litoreus]|uniref:DinB family protein n=1 Tax=Mucilaginibacter litoreus TaxID=1048221 RepID=A0ABW3AUT6_9SPHI